MHETYRLMRGGAELCSGTRIHSRQGTGSKCPNVRTAVSTLCRYGQGAIGDAEEIGPSGDGKVNPADPCPFYRFVIAHPKFDPETSACRILHMIVSDWVETFPALVSGVGMVDGGFSTRRRTSSSTRRGSE